MTLTEPATFTADTSHSPEQGGGPDAGRGGCHMLTTRTLAYRYVAQRLARGEIVERTAEQLRCRLASFADRAPDRPERVTRRHVERWMEAPGLAPAYRRSRLSALRGFCRWCVVNGHMAKDPTLGVPMPKVPQGLPRALKPDDTRAIIAACVDPRTRVMALLMVQEGLRRAEVAKVQMADLDLRGKTLRVRGKGARGIVNGTVPLSDETVAAIRIYLAEAGMTTGFLLRSRVHPDRGLSPQRVGQLVAGAMWDAGVKMANGDGVSGHALRHTAAHDMLDQGADVLEVQEALRHRAISSTMTYVRGHVSADLRRAMAGRRYLTG